MPPTAVSEFQAALAELSTRSGVAVDKLVGSLGRLSPAEARAFITDAYPELLTPYLAASGQLTAQWYAEQPVGERKPGSKLYTPEPAPLAPAAQLAVSGRWALTQSNPATAMRGSATRHVLNASRETVTFNARAEGARWVRQAKPNACGFCKMLATRSVLQNDRFQGRDLSYTAQGVARKLDRDGKKTKDYTLVVIGRGGKPRKKGGRKLGSEYHDHCRCTAVPLRDGIYEPPGYVQQWTDQYIDAFDKYGSDGAAISRALDEGRIRPDRITAATAVTQPPAAPVAPAEPLPQPQPDATTEPATVSQIGPVELDEPINTGPTKRRTFSDVEADFTAAVESGDAELIDKLADELEAVDAAEKKLVKRREQAAARKLVKDDAKWQQVYELIDQGTDPLEAEATVFGTSLARIRARELRYELRQEGYSGDTLRELYNDKFIKLASEQELAAENATNGYMLKAKYQGKISPFSLWTGSDKQVREWMSEEMAAWFDQNGRVTKRDIIDGFVGRRNPQTPDYLR